MLDRVLQIVKLCFQFYFIDEGLTLFGLFVVITRASEMSVASNSETDPLLNELSEEEEIEEASTFSFFDLVHLLKLL